MADRLAGTIFYTQYKYLVTFGLIKTHTRKQASQYDKILKENLEAVIPILIQKVLNIQTIESEELPDDLQHTKERKSDALKRVTNQSG